MKISAFGTALVLTGTLTACAAHSTMRGSVVMKVSDREAHVCLGKGEVKPGDAVSIYRNVCRALTDGDYPGPGEGCIREAVGSGNVEQVLNEHYSLVMFPQGVSFKEGDTVEKKSGR